MEINYYKEPFPHYVIDDFLNPRAAKQVLQECIDLEPFYGQAKIVSDAKEASHPKECKECEINFDHFRNTMRDNRIVMLDHIYKKKRKNSYTLQHLHSTIISDQFKKFAEHSEHIFPILNFVNSSESMVSRYGKCDFYGWHHDSSPPTKEYRVVTISYYINKEPLAFDGGSLLLLYPDGVKYKEVVPKHNRAVIFTGEQDHSVQYVNLEGKKWEDGRFSVQFWLGFNKNGFTFR